MILSVILNPLLERRQVFEEIYLGEINRSRNEHFCAGGKGINICRQLNLLNTQNIALTFLGGSTGKLIRKTLSDEKIDFTFIPTKSESRSASIITEKKYKRITSYFNPNNQINENEVIEFNSGQTDLLLSLGSCDRADKKVFFKFLCEWSHVLRLP